MLSCLGEHWLERRPGVLCKDSKQSWKPTTWNGFPSFPYYHGGQSCPRSVEQTMSHFIGIVIKPFFTVVLTSFSFHSSSIVLIIKDFLGLCEAKQPPNPRFVSLNGNYMLELGNCFWDQTTSN